FAEPIGKEPKGTLRGNAGVVLTHRACGRVARVHEGFFALGARGDSVALAFVERVKIVAAHVDLATHFKHGWHIRRQTQRYRLHGAHVVRHVLTHFAVTTRGRQYQHTVFVA